jgi:hypothetical protein
LNGTFLHLPSLQIAAKQKAMEEAYLKEKEEERRIAKALEEEKERAKLEEEKQLQVSLKQQMRTLKEKELEVCSFVCG